MYKALSFHTVIMKIDYEKFEVKKNAKAKNF